MIRRLLPFFLLGAVALSGCATVNAPRIPSDALPAAQSSFGRSIQAQAAPYQGRSGFRLLPNSSEAFMARAELIRNAQSSLDLQYYIVHDGISTRMLVDELLKAADRGVRIRILLDDTTSDGLDQAIATLAAHPQIQVRLFNPLHLGRSTGVTRAMGRLFNLSLQHRRMHNKLWLADNSVAIVGGRNLGDEYFDAEPNLNFTDIDMLSVGPVAEQLGHSFDQYWNSALSKPIDDFVSSSPSKGDLAAARVRLQNSLAESRQQNHALYNRLRTYQTQPRMNIWRRELIWAWNQALWDAPSKVLAEADPDPRLLLTTQLAPELEGVNHELIMISAYFVPGQPGLVYLTGRADAGVSVSLLTNSLEATDVPAVHGGYAPYRKALLEHGVKLYELRRQPGDPSGGSGPHLFRRGAFHGSDSSLHSKAMIFDRQKSFIGSFNFDPRSVLWNTEVGVLVDSPELAEHVRNLALQGMSPALSYQAKLQDGQVVWVTEDNGQLHTLSREPGSWWRRFNAWFATSVGLERML
ncbi:phospholipase D family protein [Pseudomonas fluorescens]|uniref:phospholipase D family protein n=1 Tax=Pseudomonas fluorescens TaxID=294 RepID=UPI00099BC90A|nr:phospholipase D family protein [Pseudomonas fluorescens]MDD5441858.1 phospholipase D family protein [Pseudomonas fluorescens]NNB68714.1 phospholipase D family protein [Pseudomonas fluorescens]OPB11998.1 phospholipase [Pseudomonas fluorescens]UEL23084.1 phospholipase D family protein [Pseudomonas fluorescens]WLH73732.1 phospholipase D family protein [Pseudomonas fluorescens]